MSDRVRYIAYLYLILHTFLDGIVAWQAIAIFENLIIPFVIVMQSCCFLGWLYFSIRNERLLKRYGGYVYAWSNPLIYWSGIALIIAVHVFFTCVFAINPTDLPNRFGISINALGNGNYVIAGVSNGTGLDGSEHVMIFDPQDHLIASHDFEAFNGKNLSHRNILLPAGKW